MRDTLAQGASHTNPLLQDWNTPYGLPPFATLKATDFGPAFEVALPEHLAEIDAIAGQAEPPTFENTVAALDRAGRNYKRVTQTFDNLTASETSPELEKTELEWAPKLAAHRNALYMNTRLFARLDALYSERAALGLDAEQVRLIERFHFDFVQAGARLTGDAKQRYGEIMQKLAELNTRFSQNVLADETDFVLPLQGEADLAGLPAFLLDATAGAAQQRGLADGMHAITLSRSLVMPFLTFSERRDLREAVWQAWVTRGEHAGAHDNRQIAVEIMQLRLEQAKLHGYASYADYQLQDRMAGRPAAVLELFDQVWEPAKRAGERDRAVLQALATQSGQTEPIAAWDWRYYAEKVRQSHYDLDDAALKPYFSLDSMINAMFDCAGRLFGVHFVEQKGIPLYHPDVRLWEVRNRDDKLIGIFLGDNFARPNKRGGAWMSEYRTQSGHQGGVLPIVVNNNNFVKGEPALLSFDDVRTLFHEFGHGLHGLLSNVRYERLAGPSVLQDFVELPSQLFEHWALEDSVLERHARHYQTGEAIPAALLDKLKRARKFNQAYETLQYVGSALIDMALHGLTDMGGLDISAFEQAERTRLGVPADVGLTHRLPQFRHLFSGSDYAAGYYVYMWAEVLDADGYDAFIEAGNPFDPAVAARLYQYIYSSGNTLEPRAAYRAFRGRDAGVAPMLAKRGLVETTAAA